MFIFQLVYTKACYKLNELNDFNEHNFGYLHNEKVNNKRHRVSVPLFYSKTKQLVCVGKRKRTSTVRYVLKHNITLQHTRYFYANKNISYDELSCYYIDVVLKVCWSLKSNFNLFKH